MREGSPRLLSAAAKPGAEPLAGLQWDMEMIHATADGSQLWRRGRATCSSGSSTRGSTPRIRTSTPNFDKEFSRNFTTDIELIDGPCEEEPDQSCEDPADVDEAGHGTHVAGTVGAAVNRIGIAGVAPEVTLVNLRAGQDSGFFFLFETLEAYVYAGDVGIDVVNMSFFTDPWLFNCRNNPLDSPDRAAGAGDDHRRVEPRAELRVRPRRDPDRGRGERPHRSRFPHIRRDQPGLPAGHGEGTGQHHERLPHHPDRGRPRDLGQRARAERSQVVLLELRPRADGRLGSRRRPARVLRNAPVQRAR